MTDFNFFLPLTTLYYFLTPPYFFLHLTSIWASNFKISLLLLLQAEDSQVMWQLHRMQKHASRHSVMSWVWRMGFCTPSITFSLMIISWNWLPKTLSISSRTRNLEQQNQMPTQFHLTEDHHHWRTTRNKYHIKYQTSSLIGTYKPTVEIQQKYF